MAAEGFLPYADASASLKLRNMQTPNSFLHGQDTESFAKYLEPLQGKPAAATFPNLGGVLEYITCDDFFCLKLVQV